MTEAGSSQSVRASRQGGNSSVRILAGLADWLIWFFLALLAIYWLWGRPPVPGVSGLDFPCLGLAASVILRWLTLGAKPWAASAWFRMLRGLWQRPLACAYALGGAYALVMSLYTIANHFQLETTQDLAILTQGLWTTVRGELLFSSFRQMSLWGEHFHPIMLLWVPIFALFQAPETLLVIQAAGLGAGAPAVFLIARRYLPAEKRAWGLLLVLSYLFHPGLWGLATFDYHPIASSVPFWLWFFALRQSRPRLAWLVMLPLALACGEESWVALSGLGLYLAFGERRWLTGGALFGAAVACFLLVVLWVVPHFNLSGIYYYTERLATMGGAPGRGLSDILLNLFTQPGLVWHTLTLPGKPEWLLIMFAWVCFLPLLRPASMLLFLPVMAGVMLSSYASQWSFHQHYAACILPGMMVSAAMGLGKALSWRWLRLAPGGAVVAAAALVLLVLVDVSPLGRVRAWMIEPPAPGLTLIRKVPADAEVAAPQHLVSHLSTRWGVFDTCVFPRHTDYVLLCTYPSPYPFTPEQVLALRDRLLNEEGYWLEEAAGDCWLLRAREPRQVEQKGRIREPLVYWHREASREGGGG